MRIHNEQKNTSEVRLVSHNDREFNLTLSIYMSREVAERLVTILLIFVFGLPISFLTAWFVSKQASALLPVEPRSEFPNHSNHNID